MARVGATDAVADLDDVLAELLSPHVIDGHGLSVLDDAHAVPADTLRVVIEALFRALPSGSIVAVASRTEPVLPTGRLRAHRMVIEIRHGDLALGLPEAALLVRQSGSELSLAVVEQLVERTEGWPAALYLASLSLLERNDAPGSAAPFRGDHHLVMEYLRDEVLSVLPPELTGFLRALVDPRRAVGAGLRRGPAAARQRPAARRSGSDDPVARTD